MRDLTYVYKSTCSISWDSTTTFTLYFPKIKIENEIKIKKEENPKRKRKIIRSALHVQVTVIESGLWYILPSVLTLNQSYISSCVPLESDQCFSNCRARLIKPKYPPPLTCTWKIIQSGCFHHNTFHINKSFIYVHVRLKPLQFG